MTGKYGTHLSAQEEALLRLVASGWQQKDAAAKMGIKPKTAEVMMRTIRQRLGAQTTAHAVALWK